jgi:hypothetical protein
MWSPTTRPLGGDERSEETGTSASARARHAMGARRPCGRFSALSELGAGHTGVGRSSGAGRVLVGVHERALDRSSGAGARLQLEQHAALQVRRVLLPLLQRGRWHVTSRAHGRPEHCEVVPCRCSRKGESTLARRHVFIRALTHQGPSRPIYPCVQSTNGSSVAI